MNAAALDPISPGNPRIRAILAGPYPRSGGMAGTYGRILGNILQSQVMAADVAFTRLGVTLPADGPAPWRAAVDAVRFVRGLRADPDLVHLIMQYNRSIYREWLLLRMCRTRRIGTIMDIRAGRLQLSIRTRHNRLQNAMLDLLFRECDGIILECPKDLAYVKEHYGRDALYVPNVMLKEDFDRIQPASLPPRGGEPLRLIYSGRYVRQKGILTVLQALAILSARGRRVEFHLTGGGIDPELNAMVAATAKDPPNGIRVVDHGWNVTDLYGLLASAHVFIMLSSWRGEGHPSSLTEAMAAGLGLILSEWMHLRDLIPAEGALIVDAQDATACADAIETYVANPDLLARAGKANRRTCGERYTDTVAYPRLLALYREVSRSTGV